MNDLVGFLVNECCADATHCIAERTEAETS
jgi:hypothetical protein